MQKKTDIAVHTVGLNNDLGLQNELVKLIIKSLKKPSQYPKN